MSYVIYDPSQNNCIVRIPGNSVGFYKDASYKTQAAARAAVTRMRRKAAEREIQGRSVQGTYLENVGKFKICSREEYNQIDTQVTRVNVMTGQEYQEDINTPLCCSPASETYWSM